MELAARIISYIFHPVVMPVLGIFLLYSTNQEVQVATIPQYFSVMLYLILAISGVIILSAIIMKSQGIISSLENVDKRERVVLYALTVLWYSMVYVMIVQKDFVVAGMHKSLFAAMFGAILAIALMVLITPFFKVSAHMVGVSGVVGVLTGIANTTLFPDKNFVMLFLVLCGIIGTARMILNAHSFQQVIGGFFLGFTCTYWTVSEEIFLQL